MARDLVDLSTLDLSKDVVSQAELRSIIPQREEFRMVDGLCHFDLEEGLAVGYKDWDENPWWAKGHIPGRPLMPGVLMIEGCAQISNYLIKKVIGWPPERFLGLGGVDRVRFRGQVVPPCRIYFVSGHGTVSGSRLAKYPAQAFVNGQRVVEMEVIGVLL